MRVEKVVYLLLVLLLGVSILGLRQIRYAVYVLPAIVYVIWALRGRLVLHPDRRMAAFAFLLVMSLLFVFEADSEGLKRIFFIFVYTSVFLMFDLRRVGFDVRALNIVFIVLFVASVILQRGSSAFVHLFVSFAESKSTLEHTLSFPFGLFAVYFLMRRRYGWSVVNALLATVALKRIVVVGFVAVVLIWLIPRRWRDRLLNPWLMTATTAVGVVLMVSFARGEFDQLFFDYLSKSPGAVSQGRQLLWSSALELTGFNYLDFMFTGVGPGQVQTMLLASFKAERGGLLHSDVLTIVLEQGMLPALVFIFLLNWQRSVDERLLAMFLTILFLTDNVVIYQHVMLPYLLLQTRLAGLPERVAGEDGSASPQTTPAAPASHPPERILQRRRR